MEFSVVDIGAGAGLLGDFLKRDRPTATYEFVEPIESLRLFLRERYGSRADVGNKADYEFASFVTLLDVLEHQEDDMEFLSDLVRKMRPGSTLLLTVPALPRLWSNWDIALGHFRRYDKDTLLRCTRGLPLTILETSFLFPEMVPLGFARARRNLKPMDENGSEAPEFPDLPGLVNDLLYGMGIASLALRHRWPTGTSLFLAARVGG
jgi:SAM-dependent methyltransferase